ncbi:hypothetical protein CIP101434_02207 [Corynebacterium diphtheriae]|nr:hypothetical protein CIP101280_01918 [Corynebacterium diphtheriae]CAB0528757.1 hypothetical protein CIP101434_02207 [Corynebacterium diphtheriae]CAB0913648.1 hypothetical protein FRC0430_01808 [Corynebacterium diphtheriae]CAB0965273.1 hypothetical protein FRC0436_01809 [Corynebacterium diphtheriae]
MFKRSLASLTAVAIASGAVVAPANAMTVRVGYAGSCTFFSNAEEAQLTRLDQTVTYKKENVALLKSSLVEGQLTVLSRIIEKDREELAKAGLSTAKKEELTRKLEENEKKLTAYKNLNNALNACIAGKNYDSDESDDSKKPEDQGNPGAPGNPSDSNNPKLPKKPGDSNNPKLPNNPGVQPAPPSNDGAGIGVIFAASIAAVLGILAAALPFIKSILPPQLRALLP